MKLNVSYSKLPDGNIYAAIRVADKGQFVTDKIFPDIGSLDFTGEEIKPFPAYELNEYGKSVLYLKAPAHIIESKVTEISDSIKKAFRAWLKIAIPDNIEIEL